MSVKRSIVVRYEVRLTNAWGGEKRWRTGARNVALNEAKRMLDMNPRSNARAVAIVGWPEEETT